MNKPTKEEMEEAVKAAGWECEQYQCAWNPGIVKVVTKYYHAGRNTIIRKPCSITALEQAYNHEITQNYLKEERN